MKAIALKLPCLMVNITFEVCIFIVIGEVSTVIIVIRVAVIHATCLLFILFILVRLCLLRGTLRGIHVHLLCSSCDHVRHELAIAVRLLRID